MWSRLAGVDDPLATDRLKLSGKATYGRDTIGRQAGDVGGNHPLCDALIERLDARVAP